MENQRIAVIEKKNNIRKLIKERIISFPFRDDFSLKICEKAYELVLSKNAKKVALYYPLSDEVNTLPLIEKLLSSSISVFLPKTSDSDMNFYKYEKDTVIKVGNLGAYEPLFGAPETDFDVIFVPLRAFDKNNYRLGRGKGYYDKFLSKNPSFSVGLAFSIQQVESVPFDEFDVPLDMIIYF